MDGFKKQTRLLRDKYGANISQSHYKASPNTRIKHKQKRAY